MEWQNARDKVLLVAALALALFGAARQRPPAASSPAFRRATELLGPEPHLVGSEAHDRARDALMGELASLGADPQIREAWSCGARGRCARVQNLIGRLGPPEGRPVAIVAHYDSVGAGPGAADDGSGVAGVLQVAQRYHAEPPPAPVLLVLTDGEELGLLGARALVAEHALDDVSAVVNLEARGTRGPSLLFETAGPSGPAVSRFARIARRPFTSSLFDAIYQVLPNDTDLSVLEALGVPAFNLAFIGDPRDYHTARDRADLVSEASVAQQADQAEALVDSLVRDPPGNDGGNDVWFDVDGLAVLRVPESWALPLAVLNLGGLAFGMRRVGVRARSVAVGVGLGLLGVLLATGLGVALVLLLHRATVSPWRESQTAVQLALIAAGCSVGLGLPRPGPPADPGVWFGGVLLGAIVALAASLALPGSSFLWLVPSIAAAWLSFRPDLAAPAAALAGVILWTPVVAQLYEGLGNPLAAAVAVAAAAGTGWLGLAVRDDRSGRIAAGVAGSVAVAAALLGALSTGEPQPENVVVEFDGGVAHVGYEGATVPIAPVQAPSPEAPIAEPVDGGIQVRSARGAATIGLAWDGPEAAVQVGGVDAFPVRRNGRWELWIYGVPADGVDLSLSPAPPSLKVIDETAGLPRGADRPDGTYAFQWGDRTRVATVYPQ